MPLIPHIARYFFRLLQFSLKILFITDGVYPFVLGGMQKHSSYILKNFANTEHHITLVTTAPNKVSAEDFGRELFGGAIPPNIEIHFVPFPSTIAFPGHYVLASWLFSKRIGKAWAQRLKEFDVIYSKGFTGWHILSTRTNPTPPVVVQLHGLEMFQQPYSFKDRLVKKLLQIPARSIIKNADYILSYGGKIKELLLELGKPTARILEQYGAADDFWLEPEPPKKTRASGRNFLFVARYEFRKGYHILKPVLEDLIAEGMDFQMHIVGDIPAELQITGSKIQYHGNQKAERIKELMTSCDAVLLPSLAEGFPTILVEAMARGLAPVATDVGAVAAVVNPENGWLIPPGNTGALKGAIRAANELDNSKLEAKQNASRAIVLSQFNWKSMHKALVSHLLFILHDHRKRSSGQELN